MASLFRGIGKAISAPDRIKNARERYEVAYENYLKKFKNYQSYSAETEKRMEQLGQSRAEGMREIQEAVKFLQQLRPVQVKNPLGIGETETWLEEMEELDRFYENILKSMGGRTATSVAAGVGVGAMAAIGTYGLAGAIGVASTGTAIASLSGAAASSATLAWLGGGALAAGGAGMVGGMAVLGGIVALPALIAVGVFLKNKADEV